MPGNRQNRVSTPAVPTEPRLRQTGLRALPVKLTKSTKLLAEGIPSAESSNCNQRAGKTKAFGRTPTLLDDLASLCRKSCRSLLKAIVPRRDCLTRVPGSSLSTPPKQPAQPAIRLYSHSQAAGPLPSLAGLVGQQLRSPCRTIDR